MSTTGIERVLQVCLRFIAICRLLHEQEDRDSTVGWSPHTVEPTPTSTHTSVASPSDVLFPTRTGSLRATARDNNTHNHPQRGSVVPVIIPPEEIQGLRKEFFTQVGPISNITYQFTLSTHSVAFTSTITITHPYYPTATTVTTHCYYLCHSSLTIHTSYHHYDNQISFLFQIMRKVENRGFMFRLDFNGYLSTLANEISAGGM